MPYRLIAGAGPLIGLARIQQLDLLQRLFGMVTITAVVEEELGIGVPLPAQAFPPGTAALLEAVEAGWLVISASRLQWSIGCSIPTWILGKASEPRCRPDSHAQRR
jgi:hypothetical protein